MAIGNLGDIGTGLKSLAQGVLSGQPSGLKSMNIRKTIPVGVIDSVSSTNDAYTCFVGQQFSVSLQAYLLNYAMSVSGVYSVYR